MALGRDCASVVCQTESRGCVSHGWDGFGGSSGGYAVGKGQRSSGGFPRFAGRAHLIAWLRDTKEGQEVWRMAKGDDLHPAEWLHATPEGQAAQAEIVTRCLAYSRTPVLVVVDAGGYLQVRYPREQAHVRIVEFSKSLLDPTEWDDAERDIVRGLPPDLIPLIQFGNNAIKTETLPMFSREEVRDLLAIVFAVVAETTGLDAWYCELRRLRSSPGFPANWHMIPMLTEAFRRALTAASRREPDTQPQAGARPDETLTAEAQDAASQQVAAPPLPDEAETPETETYKGW